MNEYIKMFNDFLLLIQCKELPSSLSKYLEEGVFIISIQLHNICNVKASSKWT